MIVCVVYHHQLHHAGSMQARLSVACMRDLCVYIFVYICVCVCVCVCSYECRNG